MKNLISTLIVTIFFFSMSYAQGCASYEAKETSGTVTISVTSEGGECFKFYVRGKLITPEYTNDLTFRVSTNAKVKLELEDGTEVTKTFLMNEEITALYYNLKKNRKGKFKLKNQLGRVKRTPEALQAQKDRMAKMKKEREEKQAKSDAEWDAKRKKSKEERSARMDAYNKEQDKKSEQRKAERDSRYEKQGAAEDANRETLDKVLAKRAAEQKAKQKTQDSLNASRNIKVIEKNPESDKVAKIKKEGKLYFNTYKGGHMVEFTVVYDKKPVCNWEIEVIIDNVVVAKGKTDSKGKFSSVYYGVLGASYKLYGERNGDKSESYWKIGGFWYLSKQEYSAKAITMDVKNYEKFISEQMGGDSALYSFAGRGLTNNCK